MSRLEPQYLGRDPGVRAGHRRRGGLVTRGVGDGCVPVPQWLDVLDDFCADEFGVKTRQFHCCRQAGAARRRCFARGPDAVAAAAANDPPTAVLTDWDVPAPPFPPGEPTATNWGNICGFSGLRRSLPGPSGPRGRMSLRLEREFGRCCRNQSLDCARRAVSDAGTRGDTGGREGPRRPGRNMCCLGWDPWVWEGPRGPGGTQASGEELK